MAFQIFKKKTQIQDTKSLRIYRIPQSKNFRGFGRLIVTSHYENTQRDIMDLRIPDPDNKEHPYSIKISDSDIVFKEIDFNHSGIGSFAIFIDNHQIGTIFDGDEKNKEYILAMIHGKVDAVHISINPQPIVTKEGTVYEYKTHLWMHIVKD